MTRPVIDAGAAFARYEEVRARLPCARFAEAPASAPDLGVLADRFDLFLLDSFGVLNVGATAIPEAAARLAELRRAGKQLVVLTNAATTPLARLGEKYAALGFDFAPHEIVSSRHVLAEHLGRREAPLRWAVAAPAAADVQELPGRMLALDGTAHDDADGFILLSSQGWTQARQDSLAEALAVRPRPLLVGNPDLVAPREGGLTLEPGFHAHALADACGVEPVFYGKPFANAYDAALTRFPHVPRERIAMLGDTLHTDILGGAAAGLATVLVTRDGLLKSLDVEDCIAASGIVPDFVIPHL